MYNYSVNNHNPPEGAEDNRRGSWRPTPPKRTNSIKNNLNLFTDRPSNISQQQQHFDQQQQKQQLNQQQHYQQQQQQSFQQIKQQLFNKISSQLKSPNCQLPPLARGLTVRNKQQQQNNYQHQPLSAPVLLQQSQQQQQPLSTPSPTNSDCTNFPFANDNPGTIKQKGYNDNIEYNNIEISNNNENNKSNQKKETIDYNYNNDNNYTNNNINNYQNHNNLNNPYNSNNSNNSNSNDKCEYIDAINHMSTNLFKYSKNTLPKSFPKEGEN